MASQSTANPALTLIGARAHGNVIGRDNQMPWRLPEDLKHFKATTLGHALIMGRRTFDSIGRPLPGRTTYVVSRNAAWRAEGCHRAGSLEEAIALARAQGHAEVFIAGGEQIYRQALPIASRVLLTEIDLSVPGDAYFPTLTPDQWHAVSREARIAANGTRFAIVDYRRTTGGASHERR